MILYHENCRSSGHVDIISNITSNLRILVGVGVEVVVVDNREVGTLKMMGFRVDQTMLMARSLYYHDVFDLSGYI